MGKHKTPAQARRGDLAQAIKARSRSPYNIWVVRPPLDSKDLILESDPAMELFYFLEGDSRFADIRYSRTDSETNREGSASRLFAHATSVQRRETGIFWWGAKDVPEAEDGKVHVNLRDLDSFAQRIENWRRIVPCIRRVKLHPTGAIERLILLALRDGQARSIRQLVAQLGEPSQALTVGAIALLLRKRSVSGDVDERPWSLNTMLQVP
jgi:hypothetical protein